ncbi:hypothetical protein CI610_02436 [invertebrate metagenome]|uniref:Uncharacterized protein n=1 Tax=invertebrate metagenome TaxID=1711999 RepID=A0A2H9T5X8_9ZZZZ
MEFLRDASNYFISFLVSKINKMMKLSEGGNNVKCVTFIPEEQYIRVYSFFLIDKNTICRSCSTFKIRTR